MTETYTISQLNRSRVDGKTFEEALKDFKNMTYYYVLLYFKNWKTLLHKNNYDADDVAQDIFVSLFNKKDKEELCNIEKKFVIASVNNYGMKYLRNTIGRAVYLNLLSLVRGFSKKPDVVSFDTLVSDVYGSDQAEISDRLKIMRDVRADIDLKTAYNCILDGIPNKIYRDYYILNNKEYKMLSVLDVVNMIAEGYTVSDMAARVYTNKDKINITYKRMNDIVKEVRQYALKSYDDGNCLIDLDIKRK